MSDTSTGDAGQGVTSYGCPDCGSKVWHIQNRVCSAAAFFDPKITHVECAECGHVEESVTQPADADTEQEEA